MCIRTRIANFVISFFIGLLLSGGAISLAKAEAPVWDVIYYESYDTGYMDGFNAAKRNKPVKGDIHKLASELGVKTAALKALIHVEAKHRDKVPAGKIPARYERHVMYRCLKKKGIKYKAPRSLVHKYRDRRIHTDDYGYIARASKIDKECAHRATSWSDFQIMGYNYDLAGYSSAVEMADALHEDQNLKYQALAGFLKNHKNGRALKALKKMDWRKFARLYNGKNYKRNRYHTKIEKAYLRLAKL